MSSSHKTAKRSVRRSVSLGAAMGMIFALLPFGTAAYAQDTPISTDAVCPPPGETASDEFPDDETSVHEDNINCVAQYEIAVGFVDGTYRPSENISRGQMATFIANMVETALGEALPAGSDAFDDDDGTTHESNINKVANAGIVSGRGGGIYDPAGTVDRAAMATFIAQAIDYSDDEDVNGSEPPAATEDEFPDDTASFHHDNINRLANQDIIVGKEDGLFHPNEATSRAQMATFIMQGAAYLDTIGAWAPTAEAAPTTNQTFDVTPGDQATNTVATEPSTDDDRQYSVSGLDDSTTYDIALFPAENVSEDENGVVTFSDTDGTNNAGNDVADGAGTTGAVIEVINGAAFAGGDQAEVSPVNGTISFTVEYDGTSPEQIIPVIWVDATGETANQLDLDADNAPIEDFGVGGEKQWLPSEAASAQPTADETIILVNKDENFFVAEDIGGGSENTYFYDSNDVFQIASGSTAAGVDEDSSPCVQVSITAWEAELNVGDELDQNSSYNASEEFPSTLCLEDVSPTSPQDVTVAQADEGELDVSWTAVTGADEYVLYTNQEDCDTSAASEFTEAARTTDNEHTLTGLDDSTLYCVQVTTVDAGDESGLEDNLTSADGDDAAADETTVAAGTSAALESLAAGVTDDNGFQGEADGTDEWQIGFTRPLDAIDATDVIRVQDADGESVDGTCDGTELTCSLNTTEQSYQGREYAAGELMTVTVGVLPAIVDRDANSANNNGVLDYPLTITNASGVTSDGGTRAWTPSDDPDNTLETGVAAATDTFGPDAQSADFTDGVGADGAFGGSTDDTIAITYDEPLAAAQDGDTVTISPDGGTTLVTYECSAAGTDADNVSCSVAGSTLTLTSKAGTTTTTLDGTNDTVEASAGVTDAAGNEAEGYPVAIT